VGPARTCDVTWAATDTRTVPFSVTTGLRAGPSITCETPGIPSAGGPADAAPAASVTRSFTAQKSPPVSPPAPGAANGPGTYLYGSGGDGGRPQAMGLYRAPIVRPSTPRPA